MFSELSMLTISLNVQKPLISEESLLSEESHCPRDPNWPSPLLEESPLSEESYTQVEARDLSPRRKRRVLRHSCTEAGSIPLDQSQSSISNASTARSKVEVRHGQLVSRLIEEIFLQESTFNAVAETTSTRFLPLV